MYFSGTFGLTPAMQSVMLGPGVLGLDFPNNLFIFGMFCFELTNISYLVFSLTNVVSFWIREVNVVLLLLDGFACYVSRKRSNNLTELVFDRYNGYRYHITCKAERKQSSIILKSGCRASSFLCSLALNNVSTKLAVIPWVNENLPGASL